MRSWRTTRPRLAPSERRMANSRVRPVERASRRFATFTQAIKSTKQTAASSTKRKGLMLSRLPLVSSEAQRKTFGLSKQLRKRKEPVKRPGAMRETQSPIILIIHKITCLSSEK